MENDLKEAGLSRLREGELQGKAVVYKACFIVLKSNTWL